VQIFKDVSRRSPLLTPDTFSDFAQEVPFFSAISFSSSDIKIGRKLAKVSKLSIILYNIQHILANLSIDRDFEIGELQNGEQ